MKCSFKTKVTSVVTIVATALVGLGTLTMSGACAEEQVRSPLETVNLRMEAYNNHDIEAFLSMYSNDIEIYTYPDKKLAQGKEHLRSIFESMFKEESVSVEIHYQLTKDRYVINHETVNYDGSKTEYVSIYEVRKGLITSVRFVRD